MSELSQEARELIARARPAERADPSAKERVRGTLAAHLGPTAPVPPTGSGAGALAAGLSVSKLVLICTLTAAGVVGGGTTLIKARHAGTPVQSPRHIQAPAAVASPISPGARETVPLAAAPPIVAAAEMPRAPLSEPVRKISMRSPSPRRPDPAEAPAPAAAPVTVPGPGRVAGATVPTPVVAPVAVPGRGAGAAVPEAAAAARGTTALPERPAAVLPATPSPREAPPRLGPSSSWQSSHLPTPVPDSEGTRIPVAAKPGKECTAEREVKLLSGAQAALRGSHGQRALDLLEQHAATCPTATFWQERSAARVLALCLLHREPQALAEAAQLAALAPRSPLLARLRTSCAAEALKR